MKIIIHLKELEGMHKADAIEVALELVFRAQARDKVRHMIGRMRQQQVYPVGLDPKTDLFSIDGRCVGAVEVTP